MRWKARLIASVQALPLLAVMPLETASFTPLPIWPFGFFGTLLLVWIMRRHVPDSVVH